MSSGPARAKLRLPQRGPLVAAAVIVTCLAVVAVVLLRPSAEPALKPPELTSPTTVEVSNADSRLVLKPGRDYIVELPDTPITARGGVWIVGGRNVVVIGGEIRNEQPISSSESVADAYGLFLKDQTGTVHVEGLWIHGHGIGQALVLDEGDRATVQVQRCRFETLHPVGRVHTDGIQSYRGPYSLLLSRVTIKTAGVGIQTMPLQYGPMPLGTWSYRRVNVEQTTSDAYTLWKDAPPGEYWHEIHHDLWVVNLGFLAWPSPAHWNPDGPADVTGEEFRIGTPPGGDYVPADSVGTTYRPS